MIPGMHIVFGAWLEQERRKHLLRASPTPRLIRYHGVWCCAVGLNRAMYPHWRLPGPEGLGLTPRVAYEAWKRELLR